jgi:hypothetical protein
MCNRVCGRRVLVMILVRVRNADRTAIQNRRDPVADVAVDRVLLCLVEDLVPAARIEAVFEGAMAVLREAGDHTLDRLCLAADGALGPGDDQDRQVERDTRFVLGEPQLVETLDDRVGHAVRKRLGAQGVAEEFPYLVGVAGLPLTLGGVSDILAERRVQLHE